MRWWHRRRFIRRYGLMVAAWPCNNLGRLIEPLRYKAMYRKAYGRELPDA